jgi:hypothetical protein
VNGGVEFLLEQRRGEAGEGGGVGEMQTTKLSSIRCTVKIPGGLRGCARSREGLGYQEEAAESPVAAGIKKNCGGYVELRRAIERPGGVVAKGKGEGQERGNWGTYSRALDDINARGVSGGNGRRFPFPGGRERGNNFGEEEPDGWDPSVGERGKGYSGWAGLGRIGPVGSRARPSWAVPLFFVIHFPISIFSIFFYIFCKYASNQFNPLSEIF